MPLVTFFYSPDRGAEHPNSTRHPSYNSTRHPTPASLMQAAYTGFNRLYKATGKPGLMIEPVVGRMRGASSSIWCRQRKRRLPSTRDQGARAWAQRAQPTGRIAEPLPGNWSAGPHRRSRLIRLRICPTLRLSHRMRTPNHNRTLVVSAASRSNNNSNFISSDSRPEPGGSTRIYNLSNQICSCSHSPYRRGGHWGIGWLVYR